MDRFHGLSFWFAALVFVAGAGGVAWYGTARPAASAQASPADSVTMQAPVAEQPRADAPATIADVPQPKLVGTLPTRLVVEAAGIETSIDEVGFTRTPDATYEWQTAWRAAGHHVDSARPGQPGNMVLSGHVSVANPENIAVFENLSAVSEGDLVEVYSGDEQFTYRVTEIRIVAPDELSVLDGDHRARLTMITCTTDLENRLVVVASLVT